MSDEGDVHRESSPSDSDHPEQSLAEERREESEETTHELELLQATATQYEAGLFAGERKEPSEDDRARDLRRMDEAVDDAHLAERLAKRPQDRVALFDLLGDPIGYGLLDGPAAEGRQRVVVLSDAIDVVGTAKTLSGEPVPAEFVRATGGG